jgi:putative membrane protein
MHWYDDMMGWGGGFSMIFLWIVLIVIIVIMAKLLFTKTNERTEHKETPLEILECRYASGEIDRAEFEEKRKDLFRSWLCSRS